MGYPDLTGGVVVLVVDFAVRVNGICLVILFLVLIFVALDVIVIIGLSVGRGRVEHGFESFICDESMESIGRAGVVATRRMEGRRDAEVEVVWVWDTVDEGLLQSDNIRRGVSFSPLTCEIFHVLSRKGKPQGVLRTIGWDHAWLEGLFEMQVQTGLVITDAVGVHEGITPDVLVIRAETTLSWVAAGWDITDALLVMSCYGKLVGGTDKTAGLTGQVINLEELASM
jgi:hypothetical protein